MASKIQSWEVSDVFWNIAEPLIPKPTRDTSKSYIRKAGGGRKPLSPRRVFEAIVFVLRTGIQWKALPKSIYGSPSSVHKYFLLWAEAGFFQDLPAKSLKQWNHYP